MSFWRDEFTTDEIEHVLGKVRPFRKFSPEGRVSISSGGGNYDEWKAFLVSAVGFDVRTDSLRSQIVQGVLFSPDLKQNFTEQDFRRVAYQLRQKYQNEDVNTYKVVFSLWNIPAFLTDTRKINDVTVNFSPSLKTPLFKRIVQERNIQRESREFKFFFSDERLADLQQCSICIANTKANSPGDANERASEAIYEILGLLNIAKDSGKSWRMSSRVSGKLPVSEVLIAPHTTVHSDNGKMVYNGFWHENWVGGPSRKHLSQEALSAWEKRYNQLREGTKTSHWSAECKSAAIRYFKAFSNPNLEESFLDGWRLFENTTGSRYEKIEIKLVRASNVFSNNIEHRIIGKHLALRRNLIAHGHTIRSDDEETLSFQMLQFILPYIERFILNSFSFASSKEFWEFLDLPSAKSTRLIKRDELHRQLSLLEKAAQFRGEPQEDY